MFSFELTTAPFSGSYLVQLIKSNREVKLSAKVSSKQRMALDQLLDRNIALFNRFIAITLKLCFCFFFFIVDQTSTFHILKA